MASFLLSFFPQSKRAKQEELDSYSFLSNPFPSQSLTQRARTSFLLSSAATMSYHGRLLLLLLLLLLHTAHASSDDEVRALMALKASLDPAGRVLTSWRSDGEPCGRRFEGVGCDEGGRVANISLQGKGLSGTISPAVAELRGLTGLYLHFNNISGEIPREISKLTALSDLYLNVNGLSGGIPAEIESMSALQVIQLSNNELTGSIPHQLGFLKNLTMLALQSNGLNGAIPAALGDLTNLAWLDLSSNHLFGSIPAKLPQLPQLAILDLHNNLLSGNLPPELKRLGKRFRYENNTDLCGADFAGLRACTSSDLPGSTRPEPFSAGLTPEAIPQSVNISPDCAATRCSGASKSPDLAAAVASTAAAVLVVSVCALMAFLWFRRRRQKSGGLVEVSNSKFSCRTASASPLISLEYSNRWDPMTTDETSGIDGGGLLPRESSPICRFNLEEVECATQYFSEVNLFGRKSGFTATYKGVLRDGTAVAVKRIGKTSCRAEEAEFLKGLKMLTLLSHENLVKLRGFCYSRARGECFLIYDFAANESLLKYLDLNGGESHKVLDWPTRVSIIKGIAKGLDYLHSSRTNKPSLLHQNLSAAKVLLDHRFSPLLSGAGLHKILADDVVFSSLKGSAAMGYLAPEYATVGRFSEKSDVYAFGVIVLQILTGKSRTAGRRPEAESGKLEDLVDGNLEGNYSKPELAKLASIALLCTAEAPALRPTMEAVLQDLKNCSSRSSSGRSKN